MRIRSSSPWIRRSTSSRISWRIWSCFFFFSASEFESPGWMETANYYPYITMDGWMETLYG